MLTVDNRQLQYRLDKIQADFRQEADKVRYYTTTPFYRFFDRFDIESVELNADQGIDDLLIDGLLIDGLLVD
jgi:hypothetical protein